MRMLFNAITGTIVFVMALVVVLPAVAYYIAKGATAGYYRGRELWLARKQVTQERSPDHVDTSKAGDEEEREARRLQEIRRTCEEEGVKHNTLA